MLGLELGVALGRELGLVLGVLLGAELGSVLGEELGAELGATLGDELGTTLGALLGPELGIELGLELGVVLDLIEGNVTGPLNHDLTAVLPRALSQFAEYDNCESQAGNEIPSILPMVLEEGCYNSAKPFTTTRSVRSDYVTSKVFTRL